MENKEKSDSKIKEMPTNSSATKVNEDVKPKNTSSKKTASKYSHLLAEIEKMNIKDLNQFVQDLQDHFNIVPLAAAPAAAESKEKVSENANVVVVELGQTKVSLIKAVGVITGKGLMDSKKLLDKTPAVIAANQPMESALNLKKQLEDAGATVELK